MKGLSKSPVEVAVDPDRCKESSAARPGFPREVAGA